MVHILVVDDEEDIRSISRKILERAGHEIDTAEEPSLLISRPIANRAQQPHQISPNY